MTDEKVIMDKEDYHKIRDFMKTTISNIAEGYDVEEELYTIVDLLEKAEDINDVFIDILHSEMEANNIKMNITIKFKKEKEGDE